MPPLVRSPLFLPLLMQKSHGHLEQVDNAVPFLSAVALAVRMGCADVAQLLFRLAQV